ncbi:acyltransferase family protein [Pseudomonas sp. PL-6]
MPSNPRLRHNNFDLIRLLLAMIVCLVHAAELSQQSLLKPIGLVLSSKLAVDAFFVISGFLIFMSYERSSSLRSYASKRAKRIYPAYLCIILLCAFGLFVLSELPAERYFSAAWVKYLLANLTFLNFFAPALPGVFEGNLLPAVNGALWTIKIEVMFYCSVPLIVWFARRFGRLPVLLGLFALSSLYSLLLWHLYGQSQNEVFAFLEKQLPGQLRYFLAGGLLYYYLAHFERQVKWLVPLALTLYVASVWLPLRLVEPLALGVLVVFVALFGYLGNFGKYGDFSYGAYICHFPIIQILVSLGLYSFSPLLGLLLSVALTLLAAILMWHLVEKRFLLRSSHYVQAEERPVRPLAVLKPDAET